MALTIRELRRDGDILAVSVAGSLDGRTVERFAERLDGLVSAEVRCVVVDCGGVTMISSHGLGALLSVHKRLETRDGELCLASAHGVPAMIISMTRLDRVFRQFADVEEAFAELGPKSSEQPS